MCGRSIAAACLLITAVAATAASASDSTVALLSDETLAAREIARRAGAELLESGAAWGDFKDRHGGWHADWNPRTQTAHRAIGRGIAVADRVDDAETATDLALRFLQRENELTGLTGLDVRPVATTLAKETWYCNYRQYVDGIPVLLTDITARLTRSGKIVAFGSDARRDVDVNTVPFLSAETARERATAGLSLDETLDHVTGGEELFILPIDDVGSTTYALVRRVTVVQRSAPREWAVDVDAHSGEIRWRRDMSLHGNVSGTASGSVRPKHPMDPLETRAFSSLSVGWANPIANGEILTDASGSYSFNFSGHPVRMSGELRGPHIDVDPELEDRVRILSPQFDAGGNYTFDFDFADPDCTPAERTIFHHATEAYESAKTIDPGAISLDVPLLALPDSPYGTCNAVFWRYCPTDSDVPCLEFFSASTGCNNSGEIADVIYHEYGHWVCHAIYESLGMPYGLENSALHEAFADINAAFILDEPERVQYLYVGEPFTRTMENTRQYPIDGTGLVLPHTTGLILGGAAWDLRQAVGLAVASELFHFAKYGTPDDPLDLGVAFREVLYEVLIADDDNGDLSDGTPHWNEILQAFSGHGITPSLFYDIDHQEMPDFVELDYTFAIPIWVSSTSAIFPLDPSSIELVYSIDHGSPMTVPMTPAGNDLFLAFLSPPPRGSIVEYHFEIGDGAGGVMPVPAAGAAHPYSFHTGGKEALFFDPAESVDNWTLGAPDDYLIYGSWALDYPDPPDSLLGPTEDHTETGALDFLAWGVVGGKTTLFSPVVDLSEAREPIIRFWRWFSGARARDESDAGFSTEISNDGGSTWIPVESGRWDAREWRQVTLKVSEYVDPTNEVQLRFVVHNDSDDFDFGGWITAAIDDFTAFDLSAWIDVTEFPLDHLGQGRGVAWADVDTDGDLDLFVGTNLANYAPSKLLRNDAGTFVDASAQMTPLENPHTRNVVWGDYDDDGDPDLYVTSAQLNQLYRNDGGTLVDVTAGSGDVGYAGETRDAAFLDYDGDGDLDLYLVNYDNPGPETANQLLENEGGVFTLVPGLMDDAEHGMSVSLGDLDRDRDLDVYVVNDDGLNAIFENRGNGNFVDVSGDPDFAVLADAGDGRGAAWGDYDGDEDLDLYLSNTGGANRLFRNDWPDGFVDDTASHPGLEDVENGRSVSWVDVDNDGDLDLYLVKYGTAADPQRNVLFRNDQGTLVVAATETIDDDGRGMGCAWADYDGDGGVDAYVSNNANPNVLIRNDPHPDRHWLHVRLIGNTGEGSPKDAIAAELRLIETSQTMAPQIRVIGTDASFMSKGSLIAEFGLGTIDTGWRLGVRWPSGQLTTHVIDQIDRLVSISEPDVAPPPPCPKCPDIHQPRADGPLATALGRSHPNPLNPTISFSFAMERSEHVSLVVYNVSGQVVRTIVDDVLEPGLYERFGWDGRNVTGLRVTSGVYFLEMRTESGYRAGEKLILLK